MTSPATVGGGDRLRLFCALTLPEHVLAELAAWQRAELRAERLVPRENLHVTLAFLGHRPAGELPAIRAALREAAASALVPTFTVGRYRETRSVGMLALEDEEDRAASLAADLHGRLERLGVYEPEQRRWLPHLTVLRFRRPPRLRPSLPELAAFGPSGAAVYHSVLRRGGAQYQVVDSVAIGG
jgi:2'-5' RNA ligase